MPLTTVHYAADELSEAAVERLLQLINAPDRLPPAKQLFIEPKLVVRNSCGAKSARSRRRSAGTRAEETSSRADLT